MQHRTQALAPRTGERIVRAHQSGIFAEFRKKFVGEYVPWKSDEVGE